MPESNFFTTVIVSPVAQSLNISASSGTIRETRKECIHCPKFLSLRTVNALRTIGSSRDIIIEFSRVWLSSPLLFNRRVEECHAILPTSRPYCARHFRYEESGGSLRNQRRISDAAIRTLFEHKTSGDFFCCFCSSYGGGGFDCRLSGIGDPFKAELAMSMAKSIMSDRREENCA